MKHLIFTLIDYKYTKHPFSVFVYVFKICIILIRHNPTLQ